MPEPRRSTLTMADEQPGARPSLPPTVFDPYALAGGALGPPAPVSPGFAGAVGGDIADIARSIYAAGPGTLEQFATGQLQPGTPEAEEAARATALTYGTPGGAPKGSLSAGVRGVGTGARVAGRAEARRAAAEAAGKEATQYTRKERDVPRDPEIDPLNPERFGGLDVRKAYAKTKREPEFDPSQYWRWNPEKQISERAFPEPPLTPDWYAGVDEAARTGRSPTPARNVQMPQAADAPKGIPEYIAGPMNDPETIKRVMTAFRQGRDLGGMAWYVTEGLRNAWHSLGGTTEGFERAIGHFPSAASPGQRVIPGQRQASLHHYWTEQGMADPIDLAAEGGARYGRTPRVVIGEGGQPRLEQDFPALYGHRYGATHMARAQDVLRARAAQAAGTPLLPELSYGGINTITNPKPPRFGGAILGNWENVPMDIHMARNYQLLRPEGRAMAEKGVPWEQIPDNLWIEKPEEGHYPFIERTVQQHATQAPLYGTGKNVPKGVDPAAFQSSVWVGGQTGQQTGVAPLPAIIESMVRFTAKVYGQHPLKVLEDFVLGRGTLLQAGDISGMIGAGAAQAGQEQQ